MSTSQFTAFPANRVIPLEGVHNFRDMGGYRTSDGRTVKYGLFFRSDHLTGLTEQDLTFLQTLNIKTVFDYRGDRESHIMPDPVLPNAKNVRIPANTEDQHEHMNFPDAPEGEDTQGHLMKALVKSDFFKSFSAETYMTELYMKLPITNPSYKHLMEAIQDPDRLGLLHHCTSGKDRTGVGAALILLALGIPEQTVMEDYLLSNETLQTFNRTLLERLAEHADEAILQNLNHILTVNEAFLSAALGSIKSTYGGYDAYFKEEFGLDKPKREALQRFCLV
ncbi:tyrosine-protein phosphatase [Paenibacillus sp. E222]|uniref:tyrosine-protein phosphatase n=1 Tax=Paenibacillus sp. E222 TaxID=2748863 RepID=UPI0015C692F6|nr:tyrosine-protein phosphatase [Paenibacillus sp. E222]QLG40360.1 tyrosine-protein phosphatase [Paenibacillus sp. E222]